MTDSSSVPPATKSFIPTTKSNIPRFSSGLRQPGHSFGYNRNETKPPINKPTFKPTTITPSLPTARMTSREDSIHRYYHS